MDSLKSAGLHYGIAGASFLGAVAYYCLVKKTTPKRNKKAASVRNKSKCVTLFFNEGGSACLNREGHRTDECELKHCPVRHLRTLKRIISKAKSCVDVCLYSFNHPELEECLVNILREGKKVRCVVGEKEIETKRTISKLRSEGAFVAEKTSEPEPGNHTFKVSPLLMHHKFVIIDNQILLTGSMNWTKSSFSKHYDNVMICVDPYLVQKFVDEFEYLFTAPCSGEKTYHSTITGGVPFQVSFYRRSNFACRPDANSKKMCAREDCMYNNYKHILHRIMTTTSSLDVCVQQLTSEDLSNEIVFLHSMGMKIRIICDKGYSTNTGSQIGYFLKSGIPVHILEGDAVLHHKFIIIDGKTLLTGTANWTMQSFFGNYENIVIITETEVISEFQEEFEKLWNVTTAVQKKQLCH